MTPKDVNFLLRINIYGAINGFLTWKECYELNDIIIRYYIRDLIDRVLP